MRDSKRRSKSRKNKRSKSIKPTNRLSKKRLSKNRFSKNKQKRLRSRSGSGSKQKIVSKSRMSIKKGLIGATALLGTGLAGMASKKLQKDYAKHIEYEENALVSDIDVESNSQIKFEDLPSSDPKYFKIRSKEWTPNNQVKSKSLDSLYSTFKVSLFKSKDIDHLSDIINKKQIILPEILENNTELPSYLIINSQLLPLDGIFYSVVIFYKIKQSTINNDSEDIKTAIGLLKKYINENKDLKIKCITSIIDFGSISIPFIQKALIDRSGIKDQKTFNYKNETITKYLNSPNTLEVDINFNKVKIPMIDVTGYYDTLHKINVNIGYTIEGKTPDELPEVLLGATKFLGLEFKSDPEFLLHKYDKIDEIPKLMDDKDTKTLKFGNEYINFVTRINFDLKDSKIDINSEQIIPTFPLIPSDSRQKNDNDKSFLFARYLYYKNSLNKNFELSSNLITYSTETAGIYKYMAKGTCFRNERCFNLYKCTQNVGSTYRFGLAIKNAFDDENVAKLVIDQIENFKAVEQNIAGTVFSALSNFFNKVKEKIFSPAPKKYICISLLTPCNTMLCQTMKKGSKLLPKYAYFSFMENNIVNAENKAFNDIGVIFMNVPLSSSKNGLLFTKGTQSLIPNEFEKFVDISNPEKTFRSLVDITRLYYSKYRNDYTLIYHCKSGKDRTAICDAIVQATIHHLMSSDYLEQDQNMYEQIKKKARYFLLFSLVITFYSTGIPGIKMSNIPVAQYLLEPEYYKFFTGNSHLSTS